MVVQLAWKMAKGHVDNTGIKTGSEEYWEAVRHRMNRLMLTQPNWEPLLRSSLLSSDSFWTRNILAFRSPVEAMHNEWMRSVDQVVNAQNATEKKVAIAHQAKVAVSIGVSLLAYRAVKIGYRELIKGVTPGDDDTQEILNILTGEEKKGLFDGTIEQLILDMLNLNPAGKGVAMAVEAVMRGWRHQWNRPGPLESLPVMSVLETSRNMLYGLGDLSEQIKSGDPAAEDTAIAVAADLATLIGVVFGVPLNAPVRIAEEYLPEPSLLEENKRKAFKEKQKQLETVERFMKLGE